MRNYEIAKWLRIVLVFTCIIIGAICFLVIPSIARDTAIDNPEYANYRIPVMIFFYITIVPVLLGIKDAIRICGLFIRDKAFSDKIVKAFIDISRYAFLESILYGGGTILLLVLGLLHPGILIISIIIILAATITAIFSAVLSKFAKRALDIKEENDLTV